MNHRIILGLAVLGAAFAGNVWAGCAPGGSRAGLVLPLQSRALTASVVGSNPEQSIASIIGLWDVQFFSQGALFDEGYDQFHSDGTEIMNDIPNPAFGNVCLGIFVQSGPRTYSLHHVFWNFDSSGTIAGRGVWDSTLTIDKSGISYTGTWTMKNFDLDGNLITSGPLAPLSGTLQATRIVAQ